MADVELLPLELPERFEFTRQEVRALMRHYARANLAPLQAKNERLRAEVERLRTDGASAVRWAPSSSHWSAVLRELFGPNARDGIDATEARLREERERAERLAEALRDAGKSLRTIADRAGGTEYLMTIGDVRGYANSRANVARDALAQEDRNV